MYAAAAAGGGGNATPTYTLCMVLSSFTFPWKRHLYSASPVHLPRADVRASEMRVQFGVPRQDTLECCIGGVLASGSFTFPCHLSVNKSL